MNINKFNDLDGLAKIYAFCERKVSFFKMQGQALAKSKEEKEKLNAEMDFWIGKATLLDLWIKKNLEGIQ